MTPSDLEAAARTHAPILVHYRREADHFGLFLESRHGSCALLDPADGLIVMPMDEFLERWSGVALVAEAGGGVAAARRLRDAGAAAERKMATLRFLLRAL
jgi:hypothetical protein